MTTALVPPTTAVAVAPADGASTPVAPVGHPGRHRLGAEVLARASLSISPAMMDVVEALGARGRGKKATVMRTLIEAGVRSGALDRIAADAARAADGVESGHNGGVDGESGSATSVGTVGGSSDGPEMGKGTAAQAEPVIKPRKPGPGRRREGREPMVLVNATLDPVLLGRIETVANEAGLPRSHVLRLLAEAGFAELVDAGYQKLDAESQAARTQKAA